MYRLRIGGKTWDIVALGIEMPRPNEMTKPMINVVIRTPTGELIEEYVAEDEFAESLKTLLPIARTVQDSVERMISSVVKQKISHKKGD